MKKLQLIQKDGWLFVEVPNDTATVYYPVNISARRWRKEHPDLQLPQTVTRSTKDGETYRVSCTRVTVTVFHGLKPRFESAQEVRTKQ